MKKFLPLPHWKVPSTGTMCRPFSRLDQAAYEAQAALAAVEHSKMTEKLDAALVAYVTAEATLTLARDEAWNAIPTTQIGAVLVNEPCQPVETSDPQPFPGPGPLPDLTSTSDIQSGIGPLGNDSIISGGSEWLPTSSGGLQPGKGF